jgi:hypothetical protein
MTLGLFHVRAGRIGGMEEREKERRGVVPAIAWACLMLLLALVLYALSSGPAAWLLYRDYISPDTFWMIYAPLSWPARLHHWFGVPFSWYWEFWTFK